MNERIGFLNAQSCGSRGGLAGVCVWVAVGSG